MRGGIKGFRILLACLALGVAAIASVQTLADGILDGLRNDGRVILGGDIACACCIARSRRNNVIFCSAMAQSWVILWKCALWRASPITTRAHWSS
ncbi:MAG: hypothetical protein R3F53_19140 [Gammaproteobacteria bacterium]